MENITVVSSRRTRERTRLLPVRGRSSPRQRQALVEAAERLSREKGYQHGPHLLLLTLARLADAKTGQTLVRQAVLAEKCHVSEKSIQRWTRTLEDSGALVVKVTLREAPHPRGEGALIYCLQIPRVDTLSAPAQSESGSTPSVAGSQGGQVVQAYQETPPESLYHHERDEVRALVDSLGGPVDARLVRQRYAEDPARVRFAFQRASGARSPAAYLHALLRSEAKWASLGSDQARTKDTNPRVKDHNDPHVNPNAYTGDYIDHCYQCQREAPHSTLTPAGLCATCANTGTSVIGIVASVPIVDQGDEVDRAGTLRWLERLRAGDFSTGSVSAAA